MADKDSRIVIQDTEELFPGGYAKYNINVQTVFQDIDKIRQSYETDSKADEKETDHE